MSKQLKELKDVNFSIRPVQANFADLATIARNFQITSGGVNPIASSPVTIGSNIIPDAELLTTRRNLAHELNTLKAQVEATKGLTIRGAGAENATRLARIAQIENSLRDIDNRRRFLGIQNSAGARGLIAAQMGEIQAQRTKLIALGVDPARLTDIESINRELRIRNMPEIRNMRNVAGAIGSTIPKPAVPAPVAGNAFDRAVRKIGGVAKRHPVMAVLGGLAAIGGAVRISKARDDGRIDPDSYYIMDNNSMSMVPRAFPSREAAMYIRDERYPGAAVNKGTTLLQKA